MHPFWIVVSIVAGVVTIYCDAGGCWPPLHRRSVAWLWAEGPAHLERHLSGTELAFPTSGMFAHWVGLPGKLQANKSLYKIVLLSIVLPSLLPMVFLFPVGIDAFKRFHLSVFGNTLSSWYSGFERSSLLKQTEEIRYHYVLRYVENTDIHYIKILVFLVRLPEIKLGKMRAYMIPMF